MKAAVLVIDMVKDTFLEDDPYPITPQALAIVPCINAVCTRARGLGFPVIFACDSFLAEDFIFKGKMKPHSLRGTDGSLVHEGLSQEPGDVYLPKRRFSAFFKTDLDQTLRAWEVDSVLVCGIATNFCVLATALDAICNDFKTVIVEDATAAHSAKVHAQTLDLYRKNPLFPLLRVLPAAEAF